MKHIRKERYQEDEYDILQDIVDHGCSSGILSEVIYNSDCKLVFHEFEENIVDIIKDYEEDTGTDLVSTLWEKGGNYTGFITQMVWVAVEIMADRIYQESPHVEE